MSDQGAGEYELADVPEEPRKVKPPAGPEKPLPRLWKTEPEEEEAAEEAKTRKEEPPPEAKKPVRAPEVRKRPQTKAKNESKSSAGGDGSEKKVLVEETPALDTYEARQRARLILGVLVASCFAIFGWIIYQVFLYDPNPIVASGEEPPPPAAVPVAKRDLDVEARSMFELAREHAKAGRIQQATERLTTLTKSYKGTKTAAEAKEALERPKQNLPLFLDRSAVQADAAPAPEPAPQPPPPPVVTAETKQTKGNATLTLPANPAELTASHPSPLAMANTPDTAARTPAAVHPLPPGFKASAQAGVHGSGWPLLIVGDRDGAPMVFVPGGTFTMGNDNGQPAEAPAHKVRMSPYYIDQHEVTVHQFRLFLAELHYRGYSWSEYFRQNPSASESLPMVMVNARDAQAYADWALKKLPTEAQWELAARSTDGRLYPWGSEPSKPAKTTGASQVGPVMAVPADVSPYGVFDLGGNALEWTKDWYDSKYYRQLPLENVTNPTGPSTKPRLLELVVKGDKKTGSASTRQGISLEKRLGYVSFRCVLPVAEQAGALTAAPGAPGQAPAPGALGPGQQPGSNPQPASKTQEPPPPF